MKNQKELRVLELLKFKANRTKGNRPLGIEAGCSHMYVGMVRRAVGLVPAMLPHDSDCDPMMLALKLLEIQGSWSATIDLLARAHRKHEATKKRITARIKAIKAHNKTQGEGWVPPCSGK